MARRPTRTPGAATPTPTPDVPPDEAAPTTPDAIEIAMDALANGAKPGDEARAVLRSHVALMDQQIGLARNERFRNRIRAVRDMALSLAVLGLLVGGAAVLWNAHQASGLVIEAFQTPPEMAATGLDGSVVAARLLDRLGAMQAATDSSRAPASFGNNWDEGLSVEVPQTGMSAGEVWRMLRQTLGDETRLSGDVVRAADGTLTLTTRVGANPGVSVSGGPDELDRVLDEAAQAVYRQAQPYRYAVWLGREDQPGDEAVLAELAASPDKTERLWALVGQSVNAYQTDPLQTVALAREALALDPTFHKARWNLSDGYSYLGWDEQNLAQQRILERVTRRRDPRVTKASQDQVFYNIRASIGSYTGDYERAIENSRIQAGLPDYAGNALAARYLIAMGHLGLHDVAAARTALASARRVDPTSPFSVMAGLALAVEIGDQAAVTALSLPDVQAGWSEPEQARLAILLADIGEVDRAEALLTGGRDDCYPCTIGRAKVAALRGDGAGAIRLFRHATELGPSLPQAWQAWGQARLAWGNAEGARLAFEAAHRRGPRWADPLKGWGDALMAEGDVRGAIRKYRAAAERAPRWGAVHLAWGRALERIGKREEAMNRYRTAQGLGLTPADRAEVQRRLASRR